MQSGERAKILDFGIAKLADPGSGLKTQTTALMGTPSFMSPEQCRGAGLVDQRSDVYALGCVLFAILTGRPPFEADGMGDLIVMHLTEPAPRVSSCVLGVNPLVDALVARCLEKDPGQRFASGTELAAALGALAAQVAADAPPAPLTTRVAIAAAPTTLSGSAASVLSKPPRRRRRVVAIGAVGGLVATTGIAILSSWPAASSDVQADASIAIPAPPRAQPAPPPVHVPPLPQRPDRVEVARATVRSTLVAFTRWANNHTGDPCPVTDAVLVGGELGIDPWGTRVRLTCTEQPADQLAGVSSAGPDREFGTADDITSWTLGSDVTSLVAGPRWRLSAASRSALTHRDAAVKPKPRTASTQRATATPTPTHIITEADHDGPAATSKTAPGAAVVPSAAEPGTDDRPPVDPKASSTRSTTDPQIPIRR